MKRRVALPIILLAFSIFVISSDVTAQRLSYASLELECGRGSFLEFNLNTGEQIEIYDVNINFSGGAAACTKGDVLITGTSSNGSSFMYQFRASDTASIYKKFKKPIVFSEPHQITVDLLCDPTCTDIGFGSVIMNGNIK